MPAICRFEPDAEREYDEAVRFYTLEANPTVALRLITSVESALTSIGAAPERWRVTDPPDIRRYVFRRFPFVFYYRYEPADNQVTI